MDETVVFIYLTVLINMFACILIEVVVMSDAVSSVL